LRIYIFLGPTLRLEEAQAELEAVYLPPVSHGRVFEVAQTKPQAIGIVDGYFETIRAVLHKEILWAMSRGIRVYGSSSMGALRAAELVPFGMRGVGKIFQAYRRGELEDDDEVAVGHGPAEYRYMPVTDAMVNIRATLEAAAKAGVISSSAQACFERIAKGIYYKERTYSRLLELAGTQKGFGGDARRLQGALQKLRVDLKREDAVRMLRQIRAECLKRRNIPRTQFKFENSTTWKRLIAEWRKEPSKRATHCCRDPKRKQPQAHYSSGRC
jgi:hypothetical protein